ncbi:hypothetical protein Agabi119p4_11633 [Agaricus bisporus var. burnettii]|uniref:AB hydrolase-1 domain-containing protein n=1 Tax=Agaricus bisporus var. burnettii TaxID=192524 RepID=A0A8H7EUX9_AGABI|nr:hypothetical protein Agabi119p4_11633 [Agaricus bisporus var. burnettii]
MMDPVEVIGQWVWTSLRLRQLKNAHSSTSLGLDFKEKTSSDISRLSNQDSYNPNIRLVQRHCPAGLSALRPAHRERTRRIIANFTWALNDTSIPNFHPRLWLKDSGSKRNWNTLAKGFSESLQVPIYTLDLRNHGTSPHVSKMSYTNMAHDVLEFIEKRGLHQTTIIGHSMGGKVAMALALDPYLDTRQNLLKNLIVVDIAPNRAGVSPEFHSYMEAMLRIERKKLKTRKEASDLLSNFEKDPSIRAFLLTNLETATSERPYAKFQIPVDTITECLPEIGNFPYTPEERVWQGRTLFIKGSRSKYINRHGIPLMKSFFPNHSLRELNTGHLVHAERPVEFKEVVIRFMDDLGVE